jgi:FkbM family methyltransferase
MTAVRHRIPTKTDALCNLRDHGVRVDWIMDVGIMAQTIELIEVYPDVKHYLFEPVSEFYETIRKRYDGIDFELIKAAACDRDDATFWLKTWTVKDDHAVTHSTILDAPATGTVPVPGVTLSGVARARGLTGRGLVKIDIDGEELRVLRGMEDIVDMVDTVIIEMPVSSMVERAAALARIGYVPFDICDLCYYDGYLAQADFIFVKPEIAPKISPNYDNLDNFQMSSWRKYTG